MNPALHMGALRSLEAGRSSELAGLAQQARNMATFHRQRAAAARKTRDTKRMDDATAEAERAEETAREIDKRVDEARKEEQRNPAKPGLEQLRGNQAQANSLLEYHRQARARAGEKNDGKALAAANKGIHEARAAVKRAFEEISQLEAAEAEAAASAEA